MNYRIYDINSKIKFKCDDPGLECSVSEKLSIMGDVHMLSSVVIESDDLRDNAAASFSYGNQVGNFGIPRIDLNKNDFTYNNETCELKSTSIKAALFLQHELNHFIHIHMDNGQYTHPNLIKYGKYDTQYYFKTGIVSKSKEVVKINEIECGWRCLLDDIRYKVLPDNAFLDRDVQLRNIMNYINPFHLKLQKVYYEKLTDESKKTFMNDCIAQIKFKELDKYPDPQFVFKWKSYHFNDNVLPK